MTEPLDPLSVALPGSRLIEASAGTGKTWTIAALYLRLVLGHGAPGQGFERALAPGEILVMTFTKAATRELSDRIRRRLVAAAACFRGEAEPQTDDTFLAQLLDQHAPGPVRSAAAWRLAMAAQAMDDAAVYTIDAWCQRMLREHAFDSGSLFDEELQANLAAMLAQAARDYWRQQIYPLSGSPLEFALAHWQDVDALQSAVRPLLERPLPPGAGQGSLRACIEAVSAQREEELAQLKQGWGRRAAEMQAWLDRQMARGDCPFNKVKLQAQHYTNWLNALSAWAGDPASGLPVLTDAARARLTPAGLLAALKPGARLEIPDCFAEFEALMAALQSLPELAPAMRLHAGACIVRRLQQLKAQSGSYGFADMLERLNDALDEALHGAKALRLRERIVAQYPVALIDEFQDTSPVQLSIFERLYRIEADDPARALLLIGDPKQAIYGFRGADIHSYLAARRATRGRHEVLGTNHRSTKALVEAVNQLFEAAEAREGAGAFMFRPVVPPGIEPTEELPFVAVAAAGRAERLMQSGAEMPALTLCLDVEPRGTQDSRKLYAELCAERIVTLLNDADTGFSRPGNAGKAKKTFQRLRPADIAVLVRTGTEAAAVREALRRRGVASVYLSDQDTVFETDEARDLLRLLQSVAAPADVRLARAALASTLLGLPLAELVALAASDERFDARCELLRQLNGVWQSQGVLAMVRRALHGFGLPARWLASDHGERRLTNVLHLAELLQSASAQLDGEQALIRWMVQQIDAAGQDGDDAQVLRLESDADLVQVVTIHKSKGLEYPVVLLPFAAHLRAVERRNTPVLFLADAQGRRTLILSPGDSDLAAADIERQREDLRLLYVALTRARHVLWVGVSAHKPATWHRSAIGYLLSGSEPRTQAQIGAAVLALAGDLIVVEVPELEPATSLPRTTRLRAREELPALVIAPPYAARFNRLWSIASYSALVRDVARTGHAGATHLPVRVLRDDEPAEADAASMALARLADAPWHRFPRGAFAGNFLHGQLEWLAGEGFALERSAALQRALVRRCERQGWGHRAADVSEWLARVCVTPLQPLGVPLAGLAAVLPEMEFWFPSDGLSAHGVDQLCRAHVLPGRARPELPERVLRGMLMGFADLVFEHDGRYWVLDYKSNALGATDADYGTAAMEGAMLAHRYDVQAALYLLALHRLLRLRLGAAYVPTRHLGGALYLFLRGVRSAGAGCLHVAPPLGLIDGLDAMLAAGPGPSAEIASPGSSGEIV